MKFRGKDINSIPDLVVFISEKLFRYNQVCVGIYKVGGRYGAIGAKEEHYQVYRSEDTKALEILLGKEPTVQGILLFSLFEKGRLLDLVRNFVIYHISEGSKIKILPRYQQIRATNKTIHKLQTDN